MTPKALPFYWLFIIILIGSGRCLAQTSSCPPNIDFSMGSFTNWECRTGIVSGVSGSNQVSWLSSGQVADRHRLIPPNSKDVDPFGGFPQHCPNANSYTVQLGNSNNGHEAEGLFYTFTIPPSNTKFSLLYYYAIVLQNPNHAVHEQPRFRARVVDVATDTELDCVSFDFSSSGSLPGFQPATMGNAIYKDWTPISVDLGAYAGQTIRLEFITSDCVFQEHFGYAYINISPVCNGSIMGNNYCEGDTSTVLKAPHGFQQYTWYADATFTQPLSQSQNVLVDVRAIPIGSILPVVLTPYPGYGCVDTLYASMGAAQRPVSIAGVDRTSCSKLPVQLGTQPNENYSYLWSPGTFLSNTAVANPVTVANLTATTDFIVKTTDQATGCFSFDTVTITPIVVDTSTSITGKLFYCPDENIATTLSILNPSATVQWYKGTQVINGATGFQYQPVSIGSYWAEITQSGCVDSSYKMVLSQSPLPKPDFTLSKDLQCLNEPVTFRNKTTIDGNESVTYLWRFSDGSSSPASDAEKVFTVAGIHTATLIATSASQCVDSVKKQVTFVNDCAPIMPTAFTPNKDGKNDYVRPFLPGAKLLKRFAVYNRWGNLVFSSSREGDAWDGTHKGEILQTDVFVWVIEYTTKDGQAVAQKGTITLIR